MGLVLFFIITISLWLIYYPFNFTHEANAFSIYTICRYTSSLTETQNNTNFSNVTEVRRNINITVIAHFISFLIVQKYFSGRSTVTINFSHTVADRQHLYFRVFNPLNPKLNPICYLLALLGAHHFLHVSRIRVKSLTLRLLMSYIYIYIWSTHSWCF